MAMGTRKHRQRQEGLWYRSELPEAPGHPFYQRLNQLLDKAGFDEFCESRCRKFYHQKLGRPSLVPGMYFRLLLIGFFEGIDSERGIAWRVADSLCLRQFLQIGLDESTPDHVTISRTRRLMDEATHQEVFGWVLRQVAQAGLLKGKTIGIDATTLEANAAMKSIVRRDTQESYTDYLKRLAEAEGLEQADEAALRRIPNYATLPTGDRAGALSRLTGHDRHALGNALHDAGLHQSHELRTSIALLEAVRRHTLRTRTRSTHGTP